MLICICFVFFAAVLFFFFLLLCPPQVGSIFGPLGAAVQTFVAPPSFSSWLLLLGVGLFSFTGQILFNAGVQREKAGPASMIRNLDVAFSFFWQVVALGIAPNIWSVLGAIVISGCVLAMGIRKWKMENQAEEERKRNAAVPAAALLVKDDEEAQALTDGGAGADSARAQDGADDEGEPQMRRKYSLELDATDVSLHEQEPEFSGRAQNAAR